MHGATTIKKGQHFYGSRFNTGEKVLSSRVTEV